MSEVPEKSSPLETNPTDTAPMRSKLGWGTGALTDAFMNNSLNLLAYPVYNLVLGVDARWLGWVLGISRIWDAFLDPLMGYISDKTRSRFGRRKPYIFVGSIFCGLFFALIWMPPADWETNAVGWFFLGAALLYFMAHTVFSISWQALGLEMSQNYDERTKVQAYRSIFNQLGGFLLGSLWWVSLRLGTTEIEGIGMVGIIFGTFIAVAGITSALLSKEKFQANDSRSEIGFLSAVGCTLRSIPFLILAGAMLAVIMGLYLTASFETYLQIFHVYGGDKHQASSLNMVANWTYQIFGLCMIPFIVWVGRKVDKSIVLMGGIALAFLSFVSTWWVYSPEWPYLLLLSKVLAAPGLTAVWMIAPSMLADVCDEEQLRTGSSREGMFTAVFGWIVKMGFSLAFILAGYMVSFSGFKQELDTVSPEVILRMRVLLLVVPSILLAVAFVLVWAFPISRSRSQHNREQLSNKVPTSGNDTAK